jgi:hypothetical protein
LFAKIVDIIFLGIIPHRFPAKFITGKAVWDVSKQILTSLISATEVIVLRSSFYTIISFTLVLLLTLGTLSLRTGICLARRALSYNDRVKGLENALDTKILIIIGMNKLIEVVVSRIMIRSEYVI